MHFIAKLPSVDLAGSTEPDVDLTVTNYEAENRTETKLPGNSLELGIVAQRMRRYRLGDAGAAKSVLEHTENAIAAHRLSRRCSGKQPHLRVLVSPVLLQCLQ